MKATDPPPAKDKRSAAYLAGYDAFQLGIGVDDVYPHREGGPQDPRRQEWLNGYYERRTEEFMRKLDQRYPRKRITTPNQGE